MDTVGEPGVSPIGPSRQTFCPALPSLQWVPWVAVPHLHRYYAPRRLPPAPLGSLRLSLAPRYRACFTAFVVSSLARGLGEAPRSRQGLWSPGPPIRELCTETGGSPKFPSYPCEDMPRSQTPVVSCALAIPHPGQTWPRHPCHPWGLKTTGFEREIVAPPDRKPLIFQLYNNFWTSKYALKTRQA